MNKIGPLMKLESVLSTPVEYELPLGDELIPMNQYIGSYVVFRFGGGIQCIICGRTINKTFFQGFCYPCYLNAAEASECILRPELCRAHEGHSRDMDWSEVHCLQEHFVYLALTSHVKVGVTRSSQIPTRWIDQGAWQAIKFGVTPNRFTAGQLEITLKQHVSDKTFWQRMLKNQMDESLDLVREKQSLTAVLPLDLQNLISEDNTVTTITYPVTEYPQKVKSVGFDKFSEISGVLFGIRGQYLIFDDGRVLNIRKHQGYEIDFEV